MPNFVSVAAPLLEKNRVLDQSITQSPSLFDAPGNRSFRFGIVSIVNKCGVITTSQRLFYSPLVWGEMRGFEGGRAPKARGESRPRGGWVRGRGIAAPRKKNRFLISN